MTYGSRLEHAIKLAKSSRKAAAVAAGLTEQAIGQCIRGETVALKVENSAKVAAALDVDHYWLATGEGVARPDRAWPFKSFLPSQFAALDDAVKREVEERLLGAIILQERKAAGNGTNG